MKIATFNVNGINGRLPNIQVAHLFATTDTKNVTSRKVLKKNGFHKVAGIDIKTHDGDSRASFLFKLAGAL